jgi:predicted nucleotidyltransferase
VRTGAIGMQRTERDVRAFLIAEAVRFIDRAVSAPGVRKIAIVGSLTTEKADPKDADILVTVDDDADLAALATAARKLKGAAQTRNKGADVFLANPRSEYIGRICQWRECGPGIRASCDAKNCGGRLYLHDDLEDVTLDPLLVKEPPIELWPTVICRTTVPADLLPLLSHFQSSTGAS